MRRKKKGKRVVVVANKRWEADPLVGVLLHPKATPRNLGTIRVVRHPVLAGEPVQVAPRIVISSVDPGPMVTVEVWCLQDLMDPGVSSSSTAEKVRVLPEIKSYGAGAEIDLVVAFGTAGFPGPVHMNGSVVIGSQVFIHNPYEEGQGPQPQWEDDRFDELIASAGLPSGLFREINEDVRFPAEGRFLLPPVGPGQPPLILAGTSFASLGVVNVVNYDDYVWADARAIESFKTNVGNEAVVGSMETTHGAIRLILDAPFIFVSGIADQIGRFDLEVTPRVYGQNFAAAHNAGLVVAWLLPEVVGKLRDP